MLTPCKNYRNTSLLYLIYFAEALIKWGQPCLPAQKHYHFARLQRKIKLRTSWGALHKSQDEFSIWERERYRLREMYQSKSYAEKTPTVCVNHNSVFVVSTNAGGDARASKYKTFSARAQDQPYA